MNLFFVEFRHLQRFSLANHVLTWSGFRILQYFATCFRLRILAIIVSFVFPASFILVWKSSIAFSIAIAAFSSLFNLDVSNILVGGSTFRGYSLGFISAGSPKICISFR